MEYIRTFEQAIAFVGEYVNIEEDLLIIRDLSQAALAEAGYIQGDDALWINGEMSCGDDDSEFYFHGKIRDMKIDITVGEKAAPCLNYYAVIVVPGYLIAIDFDVLPTEHTVKFIRISRGNDHLNAYDNKLISTSIYFVELDGEESTYRTEYCDGRFVRSSTTRLSRLHSLSGPAYESYAGDRAYFIHGRKYGYKEWEEECRRIGYA